MDESLLKAFFSLAACVVSLLGVFLVVKKYAAKKNKPDPADSSLSLTVVSRQPLPPKGMLYVVAVGGRRLLLGATEQNVSLLADITPNDNPAVSPAVTSPAEKPSALNARTIPPKPLPEPDDADAVSFSAFLKTVLSREQPLRK